MFGSKKVLLSLGAAAAALAMAASGAGAQDVPTVSGEVDGVKYTCKFEQAPKRAVSLSHFTTEMMLALGLEPSMVGTAFLEEPIYPPVAEAYKKVPVLSDTWPSMEVFMATSPDFATGWATAFSKKGLEAQALLDRNVKIFIPRSTVDFDANLDTLFDDFMTFGRIFRVEDRAKAYVEKQKEQLAAIQKRIAGKPAKKIFIYDSGSDDAFTVYEGFTTNLFRLIGAENILAGKGVKKTWGKCSWEEVVAGNPDVIVVIGYSKSVRFQETDAPAKIEWLKNFAPLKDVTAIKNNAFAQVSLADICPGIRNIDALERLSKAVYGD
ncbi:ABC transporter substrate-binding protein [Jonquetella anthropi]|uniref:ABC transporter substrate-binding protein n=1 Tax=Jonquetella anthropi TaxID=428712 RepID=UPI0001B912A0|nr:ABC transporter substrate-binding protein [Jonquetella anthropi]EEX48960.1 periplasmic binding protein [Jonquetella anthropi E3_33 E1]